MNYSPLQFLEIIEGKLRKQLDFVFPNGELEYQRILNMRENVHSLRIVQTPADDTAESWVYTIRLKTVKTRSVDRAFECLCTRLPGGEQIKSFFAVFHDTFQEQAENTAKKIIVKITNEAFGPSTEEIVQEGGAGQDEIDALMMKDHTTVIQPKRNYGDILEKVSEPFPLDSPEAFFSSL